MIDIPLITANLSAAYTVIKGLLDVRDTQKLSTVQSQLTERILHAQAHVADLLSVLMEKTVLCAKLEERVRELEGEKLERLRYELAEIASGGDLAYRLKPSGALTERPSEPPHFICQRCFDQGVKIVLQKSNAWGTETFTCSACGTAYSGGRTV